MIDAFDEVVRQLIQPFKVSMEDVMASCQVRIVQSGMPWQSGLLSYLFLKWDRPHHRQLYIMRPDIRLSRLLPYSH
jgi:hypothetical protein